MAHPNKLVGISSVILSFSILILSITNGRPVFAAETGGYPWSDANEVSLAKYEWGYTDCPAVLIQAKVCSVHYGYRAGLRYSESDPWRYDLRNCTSFVAWKVNATFGKNITGWGNANNWAKSGKKAGYVVDNLPRQNDIAVWTGGVYGHVAFVTSVNKDNTVNVEQYNKAGKGEYSRQSRVMANSYIHINPPESAQAPVIPETIVKQKQVAPEPAVSTNQIPAKAEVVAAPVVNKVEPKPNQSLAIKDDSIDFFAGLIPSEHSVKTFAIRHAETPSGKVELRSGSEANLVTTEAASTTAKAQYQLGDLNADGKIDMYVIYYSATASGKVEINVLDGASNFYSYLGKWVSAEPGHNENDVSYLLGDFDNDNDLDIFQIWQDHTPTGKMNLKIISGYDGFRWQLKEYNLNLVNQPGKDSYFNIGDNNDDGILDLYLIHHNNTQTKTVEINILDGSTKWQTELAKWQSDSPLYTGVGPLGN